MPVPAVPESLSKGVIDATMLPWEVAGALKASERVTNHTEFTGRALYAGALLIAMNRDRYEALPDDLEAVIDANSGAELSATAGRFAEGADARARQNAVALGNTITVLDAGQPAEWEAAAKPAYDTWVAESASAGFDGQAILNDALGLLGH